MIILSLCFERTFAMCSMISISSKEKKVRKKVHESKVGIYACG